MQQPLINWQSLCSVIPLLAFDFYIYWLSKFFFELHSLVLVFSGMMTICLFIVKDRLSLTFFGVLLHASAIIIAYVLILINYPSWRYILVCIILAISGLSFAKKGEALISLGSFIFIPSLYLAKETLDSLISIPYIICIYLMLLGSIPVVLLSLINDYKKGLFHDKLMLSTKHNFGNTVKTDTNIVAIIFATFFSILLVEYLNIGYGQWLIWSSVSVIISLNSHKKKLFDRIQGAILGVSIGIIIFQIIPKSSLIYPVSSILIFVTLIMFNHYLIAFTSRCFFITLALLAMEMSDIPMMRILLVSFGGIIGYFCKISTDRLWQGLNK